ncbi:MAG TPA: ferrochelatase [Burkholderiales bacterium]|nr:ferrochelatase [Burkholderiales bacterium]
MKSILLVNLGTPAAPTASAVREYLAGFLADPRVVPLPRWLWLPLLHGVVLPLRARQSAHKYAQIWTPQGSPLAVHTARMAQRLAEHMHLSVTYAMRYGEPSIVAALGRLADPVVVPLYPQHAESTTGSVLDLLPRGVPVVRGFHDHPAYIAALAASLRRHWEERGRGLMLLLSFHGLPKRVAGDYERECRTTAALLARALALRDAEWRVTFQSRFGYARWLEPHTEQTLIELARAGLRRADVVCPGFVADCLETLEEIGIRARAKFRAAGGESLELVPCLNDSPEWIAALAEISARASP